jgi:hypothetical protein
LPTGKEEEEDDTMERKVGGRDGKEADDDKKI